MLIRLCQEQVAEFHRLLSCTIGDPNAPKITDHLLRVKLLQEETQETMTALDAGDMIETIDGFCDVLFVTLGAGVTFGLDLWTTCRQITLPRAGAPMPSLEPLQFLRRQLANESFLATHMIAKGDLLQSEYHLGRVLYAVRWLVEAMPINIEPFWMEVFRANLEKADGPIREDGKRLKPDGWTPPDHAAIYRRLYGEIPPSRATR